jgi:RNA polymerase sigma-70 factor, ECF subfamily
VSTVSRDGDSLGVEMIAQPAAAASAAADAFSDVAHRETRRLLSIAYSILDDTSAAEDAVQDVLLQAWRAWDDLHDPERRQAWLVRICVRRCLRVRQALALRLRNEAPEPPLELRAQTGPGEGEVDWFALFRRLSPAQRAVVTLHYQHGYTLDQCGAAMRCRPGTARRHLARALEKLRREVTR